MISVFRNVNFSTLNQAFSPPEIFNISSWKVTAHPLLDGPQLGDVALRGARRRRGVVGAGGGADGSGAGSLPHQLEQDRLDGEGEQRRIQLRDVYLRVEHHSATKEQGPSVRIHGSYSGDHVTHATFDFRRDASTGAWSVQGEVDHLGFSESLLASLPQVAADRLAPLSDLRAVASFDYWLAEPMDGTPMRYQVNGDLRDGRLADPGFPYAFTDLQAEYTCNNSGLEFRNVRANSGQAEISLAFRGSGIEPGRPFGLTAVAKGLPLDSRLANALPAKMRAVCNDQTITICGGSGGQFQLNIMMPVMGQTTLESVQLLASGVAAFIDFCAEGLEANQAACEDAIEKSLSMVTSLNPLIGYEKASELAKQAFKTGKTIRELCRNQGILP